MRSFCKGALYQWGFEIRKGNILGAGAKQGVMWWISDLTGQSHLLWKSLWGESHQKAVKKVPLGEIHCWGCSISPALENLIQALDEEDQLLAAKVLLFCCIINTCPYSPCPMVHPRVLQDSALVPLTPSLDFVTPVPVNQCLVFVLRTALAQAKGTSCLYAKGGAFRFYLTNNAALSNSPFFSHVFLTEVGF